MAIIDYHSIKSLIFANLSPCSRILIPVLSCLCDDWDGTLSPEHSKHHILAMYAGLATSSVKIALLELHEKDIISIHTHQGKPASILYNPAALLSANNSKHSRQSATSAPNIADSQLPFPPKIPPQTPVVTGENNNGKFLALNDSPKSLKNRQSVSIVDQVGRTLIKRWISLRSADFVRSVLVNMGKKNGEIQDYPGYFVSCCRNNWIPTSKKAERDAAAEAAREERILYEDANAQRWERHKQSVITEESDPDAQARIKAIQGEFWSKMGDYRPSDEITTYARVHNYPG